MQAVTPKLSTLSLPLSAAPPLYHRVYRVGGSPERKVFDVHYVTRLTQGDAETEADFISYFSELLACKLRARLRSHQLVEDARQETFLRVLNVLRNKGGIQQPERLGGFVNSVCENVLLEMFRANCRFQQVPENAVEPADEAASPEKRSLNNERKNVIHREIVKLAKIDQQILRKLFLEELDKDEICREMGIDRNYLRVRVHRALGRFRSLLQKQTGTLVARNATGG